MMSKAPRWSDTPVNVKINKTAQKKAGKEGAASLVPGVSKQAGSDSSKITVNAGRSNSLGNRGGDLRAAVTKVGGSLKGGSSGHQQAAGQTSRRRSGPALSLCSSRSFSSLHTPSLPAAPFMRSSRSLNRLDQRSTAEADSDQANANSQVKKLQTTGKKLFHPGRRSSSVEQVRDKSHSANPDRMKTSSSSQALDSSSSLVSTAVCHHNKDNKQTRDGVFTLCAMTSGMRRNWVQAVLKNVRPGLAQDVTSSLTDQETEHQSRDWTNGSNSQQEEEETEPRPERPRSSPDGGASSLHLPGSASHPDLVEESDGAHQCVSVDGVTQTGVSDASRESLDGNSASTLVLSSDECINGDSSMQSAAEQSLRQIEAEDSTKNKETLPIDPQTAQLLKELEQTQRELSRLQQINKILQDELQQEKESHSREHVWLQNDTNSFSEHTLTFQRLQKINQDLRSELEAQKRSHEEAREAELRRRVDLLAQQAQLLVTGDATALAQAHLEQDRKRFQEQQVEWEDCVTSLKAQLNLSEEQRKEAESRLAQVQQELQSYHSLQQEAEKLRAHLQDVSTQFHAYEEAQVEKEDRLQKHLAILQASQERERRSLAASLAQAEQHSRELQERLDRAEEQVEGFHKTQELTKEIEEAQRLLQEELACTLSAVQQLQEERDQLGLRCQELQSQLSEADRESNRLQGRLKTDETIYYNLEHSYEKACEELQVAQGRVQQRESETQEMREGYERLLDRKEQELSEVLLKMEVLGNSLEETEVKLNDVLKVCTCASSNHEGQPTVDLHDSRSNTSLSSNATDGSGSPKTARTRSRSIDGSHQYIVAAEYDPERFMSVIQSLETKLYVTEEKLRDITQRLEEHQSHTSCQDPQLCSQLTRSRAATQHLSLLLHTQAKQSQRFAQETENRCRVLVGRFQVARNIAEACRERLRAAPVNLPDLEMQLATVAACLQQGEIDAEKQQHEARTANKGESKILDEEKLNEALNDVAPKSEVRDRCPSADDEGSVEKCLMREQLVVEKMLSALQSQHVVSELSSLSQEDEGLTASRYRAIMLERMALKAEESFECDSSEPLEASVGRVLAEAELIYAALRFQLQYESNSRAENQEEEQQQRAGLADISPPELDPYEEQVQVDTECLKNATTAKQEDQKHDREVEAEKEPVWLGRLKSRLQRRGEFLQQIFQKISDDCRPVSERSADDRDENLSEFELSCIREQVKLIYLSDRLYVDLEKEFHQAEATQNKQQQVDEPDAFSDALCQLQEDNNALREGLERAEQKIESVETGNQRLLEDMKQISDQYKEQIQNVESEFQEKIKKLQQIHEEEMKDLHGYYINVSKEKKNQACTETSFFNDSASSIPNRAGVEENKTQTMGSDSEAIREAFQKDLAKLKESCDQEFSAMEEMHRKQIGDLHQQHQKEVADLRKEKDQLLQEETAATMAAIVAMRRAHKHELEKSRRSQRIREGADITQLCGEYEGEIHLLQKELEMLSAKHTEKCLENSQLSQELQEERQSMSLYQKENQELKKPQRENDELSQRQLSLNGKQMHVVPQVNDFYEMEVILRAREAEMQFLRQEAHSLREELKIARMDKIYAQNKLKALCNNQDEPRQHVNTHGEDFRLTAWFKSRESPGQKPEDSVTKTNTAAFQKKAEKSSFLRQIRGARSKSLKEGLSAQERMKLFESF